MSTAKCFNSKPSGARRSWWWRFVPVLLRPRLIAVVRGIAESGRMPGSWLKNGLLAFFILVLLYGVLEGTMLALEGVARGLQGGTLTTIIPLQVVLMSLLVLLVLSSLVGALANLFLAKDLPLVLAAPISAGRFFSGKLGEVMLLSSWFPLLFVVPIVIAIAIFFDAPALFYVVALGVIVGLVTIAGAAAIAVVTVVAWVIPAALTRRILIGAGLLMMVVGYVVLQYAVPPHVATTDVGELLRATLASQVSRDTSSLWWSAAVLLEAVREGNSAQGVLLAGVITLILCAVVGLSMWVVSTLFDRAFAKAHVAHSLFSIKSRASQARLNRALFFVRPAVRALIAKELKLFARDMIQALQLLVLLGLCVVYLYNFQILRAAGETAVLTPGARLWWEGALVLLNLAIGGLVTATVCMRFVFPSMSLEGQALWVLTTAPLSPREILQAKCWCWIVPLGVIMSVVMVSGALAVQAEPRIIAVSGLASWIFCYGIVGLAVGLGAVFANFSWDHPAQITASLGAFLYLLASALLVFASMVPTSALVILRTARAQGVEFSSLQWTAFVILASSVVVYFNVLAHRWALTMGAEALERSRG